MAPASSRRRRASPTRAGFVRSAKRPARAKSSERRHFSPRTGRCSGATTASIRRSPGRRANGQGRPSPSNDRELRATPRYFGPAPSAPPGMAEVLRSLPTAQRLVSPCKLHYRPLVRRGATEADLGRASRVPMRYKKRLADQTFPSVDDAPARSSLSGMPGPGPAGASPAAAGGSGPFSTSRRRMPLTPGQSGESNVCSIPTGAEPRGFRGPARGILPQVRDQRRLGRQGPRGRDREGRRGHRHRRQDRGPRRPQGIRRPRPRPDRSRSATRSRSMSSASRTRSARPSSPATRRAARKAG